MTEKTDVIPFPRELERWASEETNGGYGIPKIDPVENNFNEASTSSNTPNSHEVDLNVRPAECPFECVRQGGTLLSYF